MLGRRFLILVAVLMGLTALAASLAPRDPALREGPRPTPTPTSTTTPAAEETAAPGGEPGTIVREISADADRPQRVVVTEGEILELEVASSEIVDSVVFMDEVAPVEPNSNARFNVLADELGPFDVELLDAGRVIGTVEVRAAS